MVDNFVCLFKQCLAVDVTLITDSGQQFDEAEFAASAAYLESGFRHAPLDRGALFCPSPIKRDIMAGNLNGKATIMKFYPDERFC